MRILIATDNYPPYIGGAQIQSRLLGHELHQRGHDVVVATVWQNELPAFPSRGVVQPDSTDLCVVESDPRVYVHPTPSVAASLSGTSMFIRRSAVENVLPCASVIRLSVPPPPRMPVRCP